jgi:hypothetical protein
VQRRADALDPGRRTHIEARMQQSAIEFELRDSLRRLARISVDDVAVLPMDDVVEMTRLLARSNYLTKADRTLMFEIRTPDPMPFTRRSQIRAIVLLALTVLALAVTCGLFGRIIL